MKNAWKHLSPSSLAGALLLACLLALSTALPVAAQSTTSNEAASSSAEGAPNGSEGTASQEVSEQDLRELVQTLESPEEREKLIRQLQALMQAAPAGSEEADSSGESTSGAAQPDGSGEGDSEGEQGGLGAQLLGAVSESFAGLSEQLVDAGSALSGLPQEVATAAEELQEREALNRFLEIVGKLVLVFVAGLAAEFLVKRLLSRPQRILGDRAGDSLLVRVLYLLLRTILDILPIAVFAAVAYGVLLVSEPRDLTRLVALALINANVVSRVIAAGGRMVLSPGVSGLRILPLNDESAAYGYLWLRRMTVPAVYGYFILDALLLLGLDPAAYELLLTLLGLVVTALGIVLILQVRQPVAVRLRGKPEEGGRLSGVRARLADVWHVLAVIYLLTVFIVWTLEVPGGFLYLARATALSLVVLVAARLVSQLISKLVDKSFQLNSGLTESYPLLQIRANRYLPVFHRILNSFIAIITLLVLLQVWGAEPFVWLATDAGSGLLGTIMSILLILAVALVVWEIFSVVAEKQLRRQAESENSQRIQTLLPLMRNALRIVLVVMVALIVLAELGLNIAPLLAGAGVIGLAVGFGAQTLVQDIITGVFILLEDSMGVGDVVTLGTHTGTVEKLTIRTIQLRDLEGNVHTLPFSQVSTIQNYSKEYAYSLIDLGVAYREDVDQVMEIMEEVAAGMREDEPFASNIVGEFEVFGLDRFDDSAVIVRGRFKTKPLMQWGIRREFNRRIKRVFDERGIEIPFPHTTLFFGQNKDGLAPPAHVVHSEASEAVKPVPITSQKEQESVGKKGDADHAKTREIPVEHPVEESDDDDSPDEGDGYEPR
ncbi:mechanosensitive ion channel family protein [Fodinicurvata fenggangensis]|uniref:mechanosensitive ion channel family protein n=1 Tax=Fodinicurvata fenggangensis TaxID=1121830 RepID=UPI00068CC177|nr:mechanosensitive ion channel domain-containing protein [Fodinicurvata fenggangensis]